MIPAVGTTAYATWRCVSARRALRAADLAEAKAAREARRQEAAREARARKEAVARQALALKAPQAAIVAAVAAKHGVPLVDVMGKSRFVEHIRARHEAWWRLHSEARMSFADISRRFGGLHHTTVMNGVRRHADRLNAPAPRATGGEVLP